MPNDPVRHYLKITPALGEVQGKILSRRSQFLHFCETQAEVAKRTFRLGNNAWAKPPSGPLRPARNSSRPQGLSTARWNQGFADALYRLLQLDENPVDLSILGKSRLHEFYYELLKGEAGHSFRNAFGVGNEIARSIEFLSSNLDKTVTIEDLADQAGMSRAVFHRKFKQATNMSPIQFLKSMRLNKDAMKIAEGQNVSVAAMDVGYLSSSQFSREFKRLYGLSPKQWSQTEKAS